jgi:hypothetical protein
MMSPFAGEMRRLFQAAVRYLEGQSSVQELNGLASSCIQLARSEGASPKAVQLLEEWRTMINRRWNEWGLEKAPLSESAFREWLNGQLPFHDGNH